MRQTTTALLKVALKPRAVPLPVHRDTVLDICVHASRMFATSLLRTLETLGQQYLGACLVSFFPYYFVLDVL